MARRKVSILKERKMKLSSQVEILDDIHEMIDFKTKDSEKKFLDKKLRLEIRLEEVEELLHEEMMSKMEKPMADKMSSLKANKYIEDKTKPEVASVETTEIDDDIKMVESLLPDVNKDEELSDSRGVGDH